MNRAIDITFYVLQFGTFALAVSFCIFNFIKRRSYIKIIFIGWAAIFLWAILNCLIFPAIFYFSGIRDAFSYAPEMTAVVSLGLLGWIFGLEIVITIALFKVIYIGFRRIVDFVKRQA